MPKRTKWWEVRYTNGSRIVRTNKYQTEAKAREAMNSWLTEVEEGKLSPYHNDREVKIFAVTLTEAPVTDWIGPEVKDA